MTQVVAQPRPQATAGALPEGARPDAFVSYSRADEAFVRDVLVPALVARGKDVWIDLENIPPSADWRERVFSGIQAASAVIYVLSPDWADSDICRDEAEHAAAMHKRLVPVVCRDVDPRAVPEAVERRNWIFMREQDDLERAREQLFEALERDLGWRELHARLAVRASEWLKHDRDRSYLLRGSDLRAAEIWLAAPAEHELQPTVEQTQYVAASRRVASRRQRATLAAVVVALAVAVALAVVALLQRNTARDREQEARARALAAGAASIVADDPELSVLLAADSLDVSPTREGADALRQAAQASWGHATLRHGAPVNNASLDRAGRRVVSAASDGEVAIWDVASGRRLVALDGHTAKVWSARFSRDGRLVATGAEDGTARLWDAASGRELRRFDLGAGTRVSSTELTRDGTVLLAAVGDGAARLWDVETGAPRAVMRHGGILYNALLDRAGERVVTTGDDGVARLWSVRTGRLLHRLRHGSGGASVDAVNRAVFSPDGRRVATAGDDGDVIVWDVRTGARVTVLDGDEGAVRYVAYSPDGRRIATGAGHGTAAVWSAASGRRLVELGGHLIAVGRVAFSPSGAHVLTAADDGTVRLWWAASGALVATYVGHTDAIGSLDFTPDGRLAVTSSDDGTARIWRVPGVGGVRFTGDGEPLKGATLSPRGDVAAAWGHAPGKYWVFDARSGRLVEILRGIMATADAAFSPDGRQLFASAVATTPFMRWDVRSGVALPAGRGSITYGDLAVSADGRRAATPSEEANTAQVWDTGTGRRVATLAGHTAAVTSVALSPDGRRAVTTSFDGTARAWDATRGVTLATLAGLPEETIQLDESMQELADGLGIDLGSLTFGSLNPQAAFSPDGRRVALTTTAGIVPIWDLRGAKPTRTLRPRVLGNEVAGLAWSRSNRVAVVTREDDGIIHVYDPESGRLLHQLRGHVGEAQLLSFSPSGRWLVSGGIDGTARVWDVARGRSVAVFYGSAKKLVSVEFGADDEHVIVASEDGDARIYDCVPCRPVAGLRAHALDFVSRGRRLTEAERARYAG